MIGPDREAGAAVLPGGVLLERIVQFLSRFIVFANPGQPVALALWIVHTHVFDAADATPYPLITSPEKRSGKSRLLEVLELLVAKAWRVAGVSEAVLFRKIEKVTPTLLLDEIDAIFATYAEKVEPIRAVINSGSRRGGIVARCVPPNHDVVDFSVFSPKCLAGIDTGRLPETIRDRSIPIRLKRKLNEDIERFRFRQAKAEAEELVAALEAWAEAHLEELKERYPEIPDQLNDRSAEGWEPLLAIADVVGDDWPTRARDAAIQLSAETDVEDDSWGVQLLADLQQVWDEDELGSTLYSSFLCSALVALQDRPWATWGRGEGGIGQRQLAKLLKPYGIRSKTVRVGTGTAKGYQHDQFLDAWARYVPDSREGESEDVVPPNEAE